MAYKPAFTDKMQEELAYRKRRDRMVYEQAIKDSSGTGESWNRQAHESAARWHAKVSRGFVSRDVQDKRTGIRNTR